MVTLTSKQAQLLHRYIICVEEMLDGQGCDRDYDELVADDVVSKGILDIMETLEGDDNVNGHTT